VRRDGVAEFNVQSGGYSDYQGLEHDPPRMTAIQEAVASFETTLVALVDTYRWHERYTEAELCQLFGYRQAFCISLKATDVNHGVGVTLLGDGNIVSATAIRLYNRDCLRARVCLGGELVTLYVVYLTSFSGYDRMRQAQALVLDAHTLSDTERIMVVGDCNSARPERVNWLLRLAGRCRRRPWRIPGRLAWLSEAFELVHTEAISTLRRAGFCDELADCPGSTFRKQIWRITFRVAVDYVFTRNLKPRGGCVLNTHEFRHASDHAGIVWLY